MATRGGPECGNYRTVIVKEEPSKSAKAKNGSVQATLRSSCRLGGACRAIAAGADEGFVNDQQTITGRPGYIEQMRDCSQNAGDETCRREQARARKW